MGCNCKTKPNAKYMDNDEVSQLMPKESNGVEVIGNKILQFFFGSINFSNSYYWINTCNIIYNFLCLHRKTNVCKNT